VVSCATAMPVRRSSGVRRRHGCSARGGRLCWWCLPCQWPPSTEHGRLSPAQHRKRAGFAPSSCLAAAGNAGFPAMSAISRLLQGASVVVYTINYSGAQSFLQTLLIEFAGHQTRPYKL